MRSAAPQAACVPSTPFRSAVVADEAEVNHLRLIARLFYLFVSATLADCDKSAAFVDILVKYGKNGVTSSGILSAVLNIVTGLELIISI